MRLDTNYLAKRIGRGVVRFTHTLNSLNSMRPSRMVSSEYRGVMSCTFSTIQVNRPRAGFNHGTATADPEPTMIGLQLFRQDNITAHSPNGQHGAIETNRFARHGAILDMQNSLGHNQFL